MSRSYGDTTADQVVSGFIMIATFLSLGIILLFLCKKAETKRRKVLCFLIGITFSMCAISTLIDVICVWHAYQNLNALAKKITGGFCLITLFIVPAVAREANRLRAGMALKKDLKETREVLKDSTERIEAVHKKIEDK